MRLDCFVRMGARLMVSAALLGCSGASWKDVEIDAPYERPQAVTITVLGARWSAEAAAELADAIVHELGRHHIQATVVPSSSQSADVEVTILAWDPGDRFLRWLTFAGKGEIVVEVDGAIVGVDGKARGWVIGGWFGGDDENSASAVGALIARTIATGKAWSVDAPRRR